jgi:hypothetical protein
MLSLVGVDQGLTGLKVRRISEEIPLFPLVPVPLMAPVPLKSVVVSLTPHGSPLDRVEIELIDQPCRICPGDLILGRA